MKKETIVLGRQTVIKAFDMQYVFYKGFSI